MKTVSVVFENNGENVGTYGVLCFLESFKGDINEKTQRFVNSGWDMLVETDLYAVEEVCMPDWFTEQDYLNHNISLKYAIALVGKKVFEFNRIMFNNVISLPEQYQYFVGYMLKTRKKQNSFMDSLEAQIMIWLNTESNKYERPLSYKQFDTASKFAKLYEANRVANNVYTSSSLTQYMDRIG